MVLAAANKHIHSITDYSYPSYGIAFHSICLTHRSSFIVHRLSFILLYLFVPCDLLYTTEKKSNNISILYTVHGTHTHTLTLNHTTNRVFVYTNKSGYVVLCTYTYVYVCMQTCHSLNVSEWDGNRSEVLFICWIQILKCPNVVTTFNRIPFDRIESILTSFF